MENIRKIALYMMLGFAVLGGLFISGESMSDPGGLRGILFTGAWVIPMIIMSWLGWRRPRIAFPILIMWTFGVMGLLFWQAIAPDWWHTIINSDGPIITIAIFALATPWTIYGYKRRTRFVAFLLMAMPLLSAIAASNTNDNAPIFHGGSAMAVGLPVFAAGALYLVASFVDKQDDTEDEK
jgi:hypothetical protein